jgi:hypothetical protein
MVAALAMVCLVAIGLAAAAAGRPSTRSSAFNDRSAKIAFTYPTGWNVSQRALTAATDPVQRFVLYAPSPFPSTLAPRPDQVVAQLSEATGVLARDVATFPARPRRFRLPALGRVEGFGGSRWAEIAFRDHGRGFYLFVGVGTRAGGKEAALLDALDSLVIRPR